MKSLGETCFQREVYRGHEITWTGWKANQENTRLCGQHYARSMAEGKIPTVPFALVDAVVDRHDSPEKKDKTRAVGINTVKAIIDEALLPHAE